MNTNKQNPFQRRRQSTVLYAAIAFISAGMLLLGHNTGWISDYLFHVLFSWPMLLILFGFGSFFQWKIGQGVALIATGVFFLMPRIMGTGYDWLWDYWPVFLIIGGAGMLIDLVFMPKRHQLHWHGGVDNLQEDDGYVTGIASFYGARHTVQSPVFKGARIEVSFGSLWLDLRHTRLEAPETYIEISNSFGGVELFVPSSWNIHIEANTSFGGFDDKRFMESAIDYTHKLVIRGNNSFGGIEIKN